MYAQPDHVNSSSRLTFKSPSGIKLKSLKEVQNFLSETANGDHVPKSGAVVEAEMVDQHEENKTEWVQGTIIKMLPKTNSFKVEFKVENAEEKGAWQETYKVLCSCRLSLPSVPPDGAALHFPSCNPQRATHIIPMCQLSEEGTEWRWPQLTIEEFKESARQATEAFRKVCTLFARQEM